LRLFKDSKTYLTKDTKLIGDKGYIGIAEIHKNSQTPLKNNKTKPLTNEEKRRNSRNITGKNSSRACYMLFKEVQNSI
jgi:hypothetical protein